MRPEVLRSISAAGVAVVLLARALRDHPRPRRAHAARRADAAPLGAQPGAGPAPPRQRPGRRRPGGGRLLPARPRGPRPPLAGPRRDAGRPRRPRLPRRRAPDAQLHRRAAPLGLLPARVPEHPRRGLPRRRRPGRHRRRQRPTSRTPPGWPTQIGGVAPRHAGAPRRSPWTATASLSVFVDTDDAGSAEATAVVEDVRDLDPGFPTWVVGQAANQIDFNAALVNRGCRWRAASSSSPSCVLHLPHDRLGAGADQGDPRQRPVAERLPRRDGLGLPAGPRRRPARLHPAQRPGGLRRGRRRRVRLRPGHGLRGVPALADQGVLGRRVQQRRRRRARPAALRADHHLRAR